MQYMLVLDTADYPQYLFGEFDTPSDAQWSAYEEWLDATQTPMIAEEEGDDDEQLTVFI